MFLHRLLVPLLVDLLLFLQILVPLLHFLGSFIHQLYNLQHEGRGVCCLRWLWDIEQLKVALYAVTQSCGPPP